MLSYPVRLARTTEGKVRVTFLDVPEAVAEANSEEDALYQAKFALELSLGNYVLHDRPVPAPSEVSDAPLVTTDKFNLPGAREGAEEAAGLAEAESAPEGAPGGGRY